MKAALWIWTLRKLRALVWAADEWLHEQEIRLRDEAARPAYQAEVDRLASHKREMALKRLPACPPLDAAAPAVTGKTTGARPRLSAVRMGPRRQSFPRLKYQHGEFILQREAPGKGRSRVESVQA